MPQAAGRASSAAMCPSARAWSSSAALELAAARAFFCVSGFPWDAAAIALACQSAENDWLGVNCGIMDQMISAAGVRDRALLIDCRSLETTTAPLPTGTAVVILDTNTRRGLVDSAYNERRAQCERAARHFGLKALRDIDAPAFMRRANALDPLTRQRARHVVSENERTLKARDAMKAGDAAALGQLMIESHISLRDDFEVSSPALDAIVDCANAADGCFGARMTGAGFGGCAVALVECRRRLELCGAGSRLLQRGDGKSASRLYHPGEPGARRRFIRKWTRAMAMPIKN